MFVFIIKAFFLFRKTYNKITIGAIRDNAENIVIQIKKKLQLQSLTGKFHNKLRIVTPTHACMYRPSRENGSD